MRFFIFPLAIFLGSIFQSCTVHSGQVVSLDYGQQVLAEDMAIGVVQTTNVLGVGGNNHNALYKEAKDNLIANRPLRKGEKYVNVNLDIKTTGYLVGFVKTYTLSADVVAMENGEIVYYDSLEELSDGAIVKIRERLKNELFIVSDTILFNKSRVGYPGTVGQIISKSDAKYVVHYVSDGKAKQRSLYERDIYRMTGEYIGFKIGQVVEKNNFVGRIVAFGNFNLLLLTKKGQKVFVKY